MENLDARLIKKYGLRTGIKKPGKTGLKIIIQERLF
jgi:hypothetical protein